jgi:cbb3-type cytochrome oxidase subunit 3
MNPGTSVTIIRSALTVILFGAFICLWIWTWSKQRRQEFDAAAQLPLLDGEVPANRSEPTC